MCFVHLNELRQRRDSPELADGLPVPLVKGELDEQAHGLLNVQAQLRRMGVEDEVRRRKGQALCAAGGRYQV